MTIHFLNGASVEAVLLSQSENSVRVSMKGADDATEFVRKDDIWVSDDCEPARIIFAWQQTAPAAPVSEEDFCCPPELAARLIHLLHSGEDDLAEVTCLPEPDASASQLSLPM